ncbi:MAG: DUF3794 domain-containing protein [Oscillospiraceae bacterium]|jgi:hypothetical protein|nr:DUF3794 domain-containing protein [Oscillospiraceae bacterium]
MEFRLSTQTVGSVETVYDGKLEQAVDSDVTLPDYCPDILRILKCTVEASVASAQAVGERVTVEGSARMNVLYAGEDGKLHCFEQNYPFTRTADISGLTEPAAVSARVKTDYANSRAVNQRRLDVHAMLTIRLKVTRRREEAVISGAEGGGIQIRSGVVPLSSLAALEEPAFVLSEIIEVEQDAPAINQILLRKAVALPGDVKAISNKLLLKGNLEVHTVYQGQDAEEPVQIVHTMPISQILEVPGVTEDTANALRLRVSSLEVTPKADSNGALRLLEIVARLAAEVKSYLPLELPVVVDAYSTQSGVSLDTRRLEAVRLLDSFSDTFVVKESLDFSSGGIGNLLLLQADVSGTEADGAAAKEDAIAVGGTILAQVIYTDGEGQVTYASREIPFSYRRPLRKNAAALTGALRPDVALDVVSTQQSLSDGRLDLRLELAVAADVYQTESASVVSGISPEEEALKERSALTIYFAADQEPLWDIARRYRTTTDAIRQENDIGGETAVEGQMLLIPAV